jgi:hypothetical protein
LDVKVEKCRYDIDAEIEQVQGAIVSLKSGVTELKGEVHELRCDVHRMTDSVSKINVSLETIALTLTKLTDFPETWSNLKGFWRVLRWFKDNILLLAVTVGIVLYTFKLLNFTP